MALTASNPFEVGTPAPDFTLPNVVTNENSSLQQLRGENGTVVMFICNHCPYVIHVNDELVRLANDYQAKGIGFIAISSNDIENYPDDAPHLMKERALELGYSFPYLYDETQEVAKAYDAACTPDFYLFDADLKATYHGQLDSSRPNSGIPLTGEDLRNAIDHLLQGKENTTQQKPSMGCNIKWK
jgi:peroxiredoxin